MPRFPLRLLVASLLALPAPAAAQGSTVLSVRTDPRVELLAIVFRLAGNPEYNTGRVPGYERAIDAHFAPHRGHPAVLEAKRLREAHGVSFDGVMSMAIHLEDALAPQPRRTFGDPDISLDRRWPAGDTDAFIENLAGFARDADFAGFLTANQAILDTARVRMERVVRSGIDVAALTAYFGREPNGAFIMVPLVANGAGNFGTRFLEGEHEEVYAIIGTSADSTGLPAFDAGFIPTMVHEFSHSFVNPAVEVAQERFRTAGEAIYPRVEREMRAQAYGNWLTMVNESLVRASVARYLAAKEGAAAGQREVAAQRARGFLWTGELYALLGEYERDRARYPSLDTFLPRVAGYFQDLAPRVEAMVADYDRTRPQLVSMEPANGATEVDPAVDRIVLRFDRAMGPRYNIRPGGAGREGFPVVKRVAWDETGTVLTLEVTLQPGRSYELELGGGFTSRESGAQLRSTPVRFRTRAP